MAQEAYIKISKDGSNWHELNTEDLALSESDDQVDTTNMAQDNGGCKTSITTLKSWSISHSCIRGR